MRREPRFKIFIKSQSIVMGCPTKVLKFNNTKWKSQKKKLKKSLKRKHFFNFTLLSAKYKMWERKRLFFKKRLLIRRCFKQLFDNVYSNKNIKEKKTLNINSFFFSSFIKFEFTLCVLLFRLGFFLSIPLAKKAVESRKITVNNIYKPYNYVLCEGDIIKINAIDQNLSIIQKSYMKTSCFIPNIEIDYYTGTLVIIKNPSLFTKEDISLMVAKHTDLSKLYWALYRN